MTTQTVKADLKTFYNFARLKQDEQVLIIKNVGWLIDTDVYPEQHVNLYFLNGFFVEEVMSLDGKLIEVTPYKQGYRLTSFINMLN